MKYVDYLIIGGGIIGLSIARELNKRFPNVSICILEKESDIATHSSGRNSGVLHAGFYYTANSLKAKFTKDGNREMRAYCRDNKLKMNPCGKIVVATSEDELGGLKELKKRADTNGVELHWVNERDIQLIDPNVKTYKWALFSPTTTSVDPGEVCQTIKGQLIERGVNIMCNVRYQGTSGTSDRKVITDKGTFSCDYFINAAGLYADKVAADYGFGETYTIVPFKGTYLQYRKNKADVLTNIYPVPNLSNPFLGVHFTKTVDHAIKIGPTAIPALWRENYKGFNHFRMKEFLTISYYETKLFVRNSFGFRSLAMEEMKKYMTSYFVDLALKMVKGVDGKRFVKANKPGIRAQLLNKHTLELVQDFVVEGDHRSFHVLNAVSPGFTCAFPFSRFIVDEIIRKRKVENRNEFISSGG